MKPKIHALAGAIGLLMITLFWTSTVFSELFGSHEAVATVKTMILRGMFILLPAMIIVGASGMAMGKTRTDAPALAKKKRMPIIAANGLLILLPAAFFLKSKAVAGEFDGVFYTVQIIELIAGATNITLMIKNMRDGLRMTGRLDAKTPQTNNAPKTPSISERENGPLVVKALSQFTDTDDTQKEAKPVMALCRCGASKNKPYCDGSHNNIGFTSAFSGENKKDKLRSYEGKEITVHYNAALCYHAAECVSHLKPVFDPKRKPWILPDAASKDEIISVVKACPSGALSYSVAGSPPNHAVETIPSLKIAKDGPYMVNGIPLENARLAEGGSDQKYALCRCGASKNKPYCDGSHHDIGWKDDE